MPVSQKAQSLSTLGFDEVTEDVTCRLLICSQALDKCGKTHFALTAPGPIGIVNMDDGLEGVAEKFVKGTVDGIRRRIFVKSIPITTVNAKPQDWVNEWKFSVDAYHQLLAHPDIRTVLIDTGTAWWRLARLAEFGTLNPSGDIKRSYGPLNNMYEGLLREAFQTDKNLIITHKLKEKWINKKVMVPGKGEVNQDVWDGQYKRDGYGETAFVIQANLEHSYNRELAQFETRIINCRQNWELTDMTMSGKENDFATLGQMVFPGTVAKDWQ